MSKAFTRENDDAESETIPARVEIESGGRRYITADGAERLRNELAVLEGRLREHAGDEDEDARQTSRRMKARMQAIAETLARVEVVPNGDGPSGEVRFGLCVTIRHEDGAEDEYRLVGVDEVDPAGSSISWLSPLAQALMGRKMGEVVRFQTPAGERVLRIVRIRPLSL